MRHTLQRFIAGACAIVTTYLCVVAAQTSAPQATASVTGRVTLDGRALANAEVMLKAKPKEAENMFQSLMEGGEARKCSTDGEGHYRFNEVAAGSYNVTVFAPTLVADKFQSNIVVPDGGAVDGVDFALKMGGVITGAVILADGRPAIGKTIELGRIGGDKARPDTSPEELQASLVRGLSASRTDHRGVYRVYGIAPGDYLVSVSSGGHRRESLQTFYPGVTEKTRAVPVKVKAGSETTGIDFKLGLAKKKGYEVRGRVIDESGKPVPSVIISYVPAHDGKEGEEAGGIGAVGSDGAHSNAQGEFKLGGVLPGKYKASVVSMFDQAGVYSDPTPFEVGNRDIEGVEIRTHKGLTASGIAVIEGNDDPAVAAQLSQVQLMGGVTGGGGLGFSVSRATIGADGAFAMTGLSPGNLDLMVNPLLGNNRFAILRVERSGAPQHGGIEITPGNPVTDIRVVLGYGNCTIYGRAVLEGGPLPKGSSLYVQIQRLGSEAAGPDLDIATPVGLGRSAVARHIEVAPGGEFRAEGLVPGEYEVTLTTSRYPPPPPPGGGAEPNSGRQRVTLTGGVQLEVNLSLNLTSDK